MYVSQCDYIEQQRADSYDVLDTGNTCCCVNVWYAKVLWVKWEEVEFCTDVVCTFCTDVVRSINIHTSIYIYIQLPHIPPPLLYEQLTKGFSSMHVIQLEREFLVHTRRCCVYLLFKSTSLIFNNYIPIYACVQMDKCSRIPGNFSGWIIIWEVSLL